MKQTSKGKRNKKPSLLEEVTSEKAWSVNNQQIFGQDKTQQMEFNKVKRKYSETGAPVKSAPKNMMERYIPVDLNYPGLTVLNYDPPVFRVDNFFSDEECDRYITAVEEKGTQIASQTFSGLTSSARTSTTWYMYYKDVPEFLCKAQKLSGLSLENFEEAQIVRYQMGQQFTWHYDAVPKNLLENGGQRVGTLLVYLNDVSQGGATTFKDIGISVKPKKGSALLFFPAFADGTPDDRTLHAGTMAMDEKWIAQTWLHQGDYKPCVPSDNSKDDAKVHMEMYDGKIPLQKD
eukprot:CAMPEP_0117753216 /NCGR_PEP_ID=MMETSP0947-20121206/12086_1 /TAXON_ID=44440 /ORGANISM="Chattonella subsalsa, Strain CCMP2191" /LENGTH=289 /DNA_ID=CAMNT_0005572041 /DNA_START=258 /DNA_END=1127 /DNA_ORIENTATION=+